VKNQATSTEPPEQSGDTKTVRKREGIFDETFLVVITGLGNVFNFYFHIYMSRNLGPERYSALNSLMSLLFWLNIPIVTVQTTVAKFVAQFSATAQETKVRRVLLECAKRVGVAAFVLMTAIIFGAPLIGEFLNIHTNTPIVISGVLLFFMYMMPVFWAVLQGRERFGFLGMSYFTNFTTKCGLGILFAVIGWGVGGVLFGVVLSFGFAFIVAFWPLREVIAQKGGDDRVEMGDIYRFGLPVVISLLCLYSFCNLDIPLVRHFYGATEEGLQLAGYYATASIIGKGFLFLPLGIILALFPKVTRKKATGENPVPVLVRGLALEIVLSLGGIIVCILIARYLAILLSKNDAPELVALIRIFGIAITPVAVTMILVHYNLALERYGFIWMLLPVTLLTFLGIWLFHETPMTVLMIIASGGFLLLVCVLLFTLYAHRRFTADLQSP
jgi:O-antigen/teichoic acid export membrane protein